APSMPRLAQPATAIDITRVTSSGYSFLIRTLPDQGRSTITTAGAKRNHGALARSLGKGWRASPSPHLPQSPPGLGPGQRGRGGRDTSFAVARAGGGGRWGIDGVGAAQGSRSRIAGAGGPSAPRLEQAQHGRAAVQ